MESSEILRRFDREMRRRPPEIDGSRIEEEGAVVRQVGRECAIAFSDLTEATAAQAVREQTAYFHHVGMEVEWKVFGHDRPASLGELLSREGWVPDPEETMVVYDLQEPGPSGGAPEGVDIRRIPDRAALIAAANVSEEAFGAGRGWSASEYLPRLDDPAFAAFAAYVGDTAVSSARLEMPPGRSFASLWGGGVVPDYRGRGIYRALVATRCDLARSRGYRFVTVDALETSRPILERMGFRALTTVRGWVLKPASTPG